MTVRPALLAACDVGPGLTAGLHRHLLLPCQPAPVPGTLGPRQSLPPLPEAPQPTGPQHLGETRAGQVRRNPHLGETSTLEKPAQVTLGWGEVGGRDPRAAVTLLSAG